MTSSAAPAQPVGVSILDRYGRRHSARLRYLGADDHGIEQWELLNPMHISDRLEVESWPSTAVITAPYTAEEVR